MPWGNLIIGVLSNIIAFVLGVSSKRILEYYRFRDFKKFFGSDFLKNPSITVDVYNYNNNIIRAADKNKRYIKYYPTSAPIPIIGVDKVMSVETTKITQLLTSEFYRETKKVIPIMTDEEVFDKWDGTFICLGSSDSNIKTKGILEKLENNFVDFDFDKGERVIKRKSDGTIFKITQKPPRDKSIIVKISNKEFNNQKMFVCAGLGEWGTSGAVWYLSKYWKTLYKEHGESDFGIILETEPKSLESTRVIQ